MPDIKAPWMHVAKALLGESEIAGDKHNPRIVEMFRVGETPQFKSDETAWCAAFENAVLVCTGYAGTKSALASSFAKFGTDLGNQPIYGCIVVFWPLTSGASGHVGFFLEKNDDGTIDVLGGNQSNKVSIQSFAAGKVRSYRLPVVTRQIPETSLPTILTLAPSEAPAHLRPSQPIVLPPTVRPLPADNFKRVHEGNAPGVKSIREWEGGYSDHPEDDGGPTNHGITQATLAKWRGHEVAAEDVKALTYEEAFEILKTDYYDVLRGDEMPIALALMAYNTGLNSGTDRGARFLQEALAKQGLDLGPDGIDGDVGPYTRDAAARADVMRAVQDHSEIYEAAYRGFKKFPTFGKGWLGRLEDITTTAKSWAHERPVIAPTVPVPVEQPMPQQPQFPQIDLGQIINVIGMLGGLLGGQRLPMPTFPPTPTQPGQPGQPAPQFNFLTLIPIVLSIVSALGGWAQAIRIVTMIITAVAPLLQQMQQQQQR